MLGLSRRDFPTGIAVRVTDPSSIPFRRKREQPCGSDNVAGSTRRSSLRSGTGRPRRRALARTPLAERPRRRPIVSGCIPAIRHAMRRRVSGTDQPRAPGLRIGRSCGVCSPSRTRLSKSASRERLRKRHKASSPWPAATMPDRTMSKGNRAAATRCSAGPAKRAGEAGNSVALARPFVDTLHSGSKAGGREDKL